MKARPSGRFLTPRDILTQEEQSKLFRALHGVGVPSRDAADRVCDIIGEIVADRLLGCREFLGGKQGFCGETRDEGDLYCQEHRLERREFQRQLMETQRDR